MVFPSGSRSTRSVALIVSFLLVSGAAPAALLSPSAVYAAGTYLTLDQFSGHPGVTIAVRGGGYAPGETVALSETIGATVAVTASATAGTDGEFTPVSMTVPVNAPQGAVTFTAVGTTSAQMASNAYYVTPFNPSLSASGDTNTPGSTLTLSGTGFAPKEAIVLTFATIRTSVTTDAQGAFSGATLTIPTVPAAVYQPTAVGQQSGAQAVTYFYVGGFFASVSPSTYYLLPEQDLSFNGAGFAPGETVTVMADMATTPSASFTTDSKGAFKNAGSITMPASFASSAHTFHLVGTSSKASGDVSVTVGQYFPSAYPSAYYLLPGGALSFSGSGFFPGEQVNVYQDLNTTASTTFTVDTNGAFLAAGNVTLPLGSGGSQVSYNLVGAHSGAQIAVVVTVGQLYPQLSPSSYYLRPSETFTATGSGFLPGEAVSLVVGKVTTTVTADAKGNAAFTGLVMPQSALPTLTFTATGAFSKAVATVDVSVGAYYPYASADQYYVLPGTPVVVTGAGFAPGETVDVTMGSVSATTAADKMGSTSPVSLTVPFGLKDATVTLKGETSLATATLALTLAPFNPQVSLDTYYTQPGTTIKVNTSGFAPGETVTATLGTASGTAVVDSLGNVPAISLTVPFKLLDTTVTVTGGTSKASASTSLTLAPFAAQVSPSTYWAARGTSVDFSGTGFVPGETVAVTRNKTALTTVTADAKGAISILGDVLPFGTSADYTFTGAQSGASSSLSIGLAGFYPGVGLDSYYALGGTAVTVSGSGFYPGEAVKVSFGGVDLGTQVSDGKGAFTLKTTVPYAVPGSKAVVATGSLSGASASTTFTLADLPSMSLSMTAYAAHPGDLVQFVGTGYLPGEPVVVTSDRGDVSFSFTADTNGSFTAGGTLPAGLVAGNLTFTVTGQHSLSPRQITFYVQ